MSWLQDLAGKAETMLNKLDQNAAEVLMSSPSQNEIKPPSKPATPVVKTNLVPQKTERTPLRGNAMNLKASPRKPIKFVIDPDDMSASKPDLEQADSEADEKATVSSSRHSSVSSKMGTVIDMPKPETKHPSDASFKSDNDELLATKIVLNDVKAERDELKQEVESLTNELNDSRNDSRLKELEDLVQCLSEEKHALTEKYRQLELSNSKYIKSISELESSLSKLHQTEHELREHSETSKAEAAQAVQELQQYRVRAQLTLTAKEKLIEQLKVGVTGAGTDAEPTWELEIGQLKTEKKDLLDEITRLQEKNEQAKLCFDNLEADMKAAVKTVEAKLVDSQATLQKETRRVHQLTDEVKAEKRELETARQEMQRQRLQLTTKLHEKEQELQRLQKRQTTVAQPSGDDVENRMQALTASLVQKQTNLETAMAEKNALRIQLEKMEARLALELTKARPQVVHIYENETDDAKSLVPNFIQENPFDTRFARRFKRAYSSLDSVGIRLGVFMRYPLARIMIIFYILILHTFIFLLLFAATPS